MARSFGDVALRELEEELLHPVEAEAGLRARGLVGEALGHSGGEQPESHLVDGATGSRDLRDDLPALAAVGEHLLDAADLTFDATQPLQQFLGDVVGERHAATSSLVWRRIRSIV